MLEGCPAVSSRSFLMKDTDKKVKTVLIVDDDDDDREMFREALQLVDDHANCLVAEDGKKALDLLRMQPDHLPDFIFLDLNMPRMDGKQCLAKIKQDEYLQKIPVIIYTTSKHPKDMEETKNLGADYFISKPFHFDEICKFITYVLSENWKR